MSSIPTEHSSALAQLKALEIKHWHEVLKLKEKVKAASRKLRNVRKGIAALSETEKPFLASEEITSFIKAELQGGKSSKRADLMRELSAHAKKSGCMATGLGLALDRVLKSNDFVHANGEVRLRPSA